MSSRKDKIYAPIKGVQEAPCDGRKKSSKKLSHKLLRSHLKQKLKDEIEESTNG